MTRRAKTVGLLILGAMLLGFAWAERWRADFECAEMDAGGNVNLGQIEVADSRSASSRKPGRPRVRRMSDEEVRTFLRETEIRELKFEDTEADEAVRQVNEILRKQMPEARVPKIVWVRGEIASVVTIKQMHLRDMPVDIALKYVADATRRQVRVHEGAVLLLELTD